MNQYPRTFVPANVDFSDYSKIDPLALELLRRPIDSPASLERWLADFSELVSAVYEYGGRRYIELSCHTDDPVIEKAFLHFVEHIEEKFKSITFELQKRFLESPHRNALTDRRYKILARNWQAEVELFREENVSLQTEEAKLNTEYDKLCGAMMVTLDGRDMTLRQARKILEETDRARRQTAWEAAANRQLADRDQMDTLFDQMLAKRQTIATISGFADYREYRWKALNRFDYMPRQCLEFADAIADICVPIVRQLDQQRASDLKLEKLRPWDRDVHPHGLPPLRPFDEREIDRFVAKTTEIFARLSPQLADDFDSLRVHNNLDLGSRRANRTAATNRIWKRAADRSFL